ncbi:hypothetical protein [Labrys neptuniae]|uniref:hypothetical protein n=1 Tax=Labrys neptuniae TaxID=376174 RepID=UPI00373FDB1A
MFIPLALAFGAIAGISVGVWAGKGYPTLSVWPTSSSDWAAWIQAIGSIVGIGIAIYVPWAQAKAESRARAAEDLKAETERAANAYGLRCLILDDLKHLTRYLQLATIKEPIEVPQSLKEHEAKLYLLGEPGTSILVGLSRLYALNRDFTHKRSHAADQEFAIWYIREAPKLINSVARCFDWAVDRLVFMPPPFPVESDRTAESVDA